MRIYHAGIFGLLCAMLACCYGQNNNGRQLLTDKNNRVGGSCDGCELMFVGIPATINYSDTSTGWEEEGQKLLVTGTAYKPDGKTPAGNVILYYWQTGNNGLYTQGPGMDKKARAHGHIRGWVKTDEEGKYAIYTVRPAPYPGESLPAHIHIIVKEPELQNEYYIDDVNFDDDKLLIPHLKKYPQENRGGSGIVRVLLKDDLQIAEHDIVLGLNIPHYPKVENQEIRSGLNIGEDQPSFTPFHAWGPDRGTRACPVCKYGRYHGILYFVGNKPDWADIKKWLLFLEQESISRSQYLKAYFVLGNESSFSETTARAALVRLGNELKLTHLALTFVPSFNDAESEANLNKVNAAAENTFVIYRHRRIVDKFVNLKASEENFNLISSTLDKTKGAYFELPEPKHE